MLSLFVQFQTYRDMIATCELERKLSLSPRLCVYVCVWQVERQVALELPESRFSSPASEFPVDKSIKLRYDRVHCIFAFPRFRSRRGHCHHQMPSSVTFNGIQLFLILHTLCACHQLYTALMGGHKTSLVIDCRQASGRFWLPRWRRTSSRRVSSLARVEHCL